MKTVVKTFIILWIMLLVFVGCKKESRETGISGSRTDYKASGSTKEMVLDESGEESGTFGDDEPDIYDDPCEENDSDGFAIVPLTKLNEGSLTGKSVTCIRIKANQPDEIADSSEDESEHKKDPCQVEVANNLKNYPGGELSRQDGLVTALEDSVEDSDSGYDKRPADDDGQAYDEEDQVDYDEESDYPGAPDNSSRDAVTVYEDSGGYDYEDRVSPEPVEDTMPEAYARDDVPYDLIETADNNESVADYGQADVYEESPEQEVVTEYEEMPVYEEPETDQPEQDNDEEYDDQDNSEYFNDMEGYEPDTGMHESLPEPAEGYPEEYYPPEEYPVEPVENEEPYYEENPEYEEPSGMEEPVPEEPAEEYPVEEYYPEEGDYPIENVEPYYDEYPEYEEPPDMEGTVPEEPAPEYPEEYYPEEDYSPDIYPVDPDYQEPPVYDEIPGYEPNTPLEPQEYYPDEYYP
ncbi:MAG: hypothetical protein JW860_12085 [Sedimentisphaerales bacterium]|nr:hypothetical protein [Sedimentisphaerales bacterium]